VIHRTTFETDRLPLDWLPILKRADQVWIMSEFNRRVFVEQGVPPERLSVIPTPVTWSPSAGIEPLRILNRRAFNFLSVFSWGRRKGWDLLVRAFLSEFREDDDVSLTLRVSSLPERPQVEIQDTVREFIRKDLGRDPDREPPILFVDETLSNAEMWELFKQADAFVLPSRGEGFGRPYAEALVAGLPTIATRFGGQLDFLTDENSYLIDVEGLEYAEGDAPVFVGHRWARPSVEHLRCLMRQVYECPEEGRQKARGAIGEILSRFSVRRVANLIVRELNRLDGVCHGR
jgi:glycosyltransferase involved in cell wall biosynthesis